MFLQVELTILFAPSAASSPRISSLDVLGSQDPVPQSATERGRRGRSTGSRQSRRRLASSQPASQVGFLELVGDE